MPKTRGFSLKHRLTALFQRRRHNPARRIRIGLMDRIRSAVAKTIGAGRGYSRIGQDPVPKGHMAVYVGQGDGGFERILVPVVYFNHPLFGDLLRESEKEFGFDQPGPFTIPCRVSEFERVHSRIKTGRELKNPNRRLTGW